MTVEPIIATAIAEEDVFIVLSHDCDVANPDLDKEPFVELILARRIERSVDGNLTFGKNPRQLTLEIGGGWYDISIHTKCRCPRQELSGKTAVGTMDDDSLRLLRRWAAQRYQRAAFADTFNTRTAAIGKSVHDLLKKEGQFLSGIYLVVSDAELPPDQPYVVIVLATMTTDQYAEPELRRKAQVLVDQVAAFLDGCIGVRVEDSEVRPESAVSLDDIRVLKRWDVEYLSFRTTPGGSMSPDPL